MSKQTDSSSEGSPSDINDEDTSSHHQQRKGSKRKQKKLAIKSYVADLLAKSKPVHGQAIDLARAQFSIKTTAQDHGNFSAFRQYHSQGEQRSTSDHGEQERSSTIDDDDDIGTERVKQIFSFIFNGCSSSFAFSRMIRWQN